MVIPDILLQQHVTDVRTTLGGGVIVVGEQPQTLRRAAAYPQTTFFGESQLPFTVPKNVEISEVIIHQTVSSLNSMPFNFGQMSGRTPNLSSNPYCSGGGS
jgi:hypothetical protein